MYGLCREPSVPTGLLLQRCAAQDASTASWPPKRIPRNGFLGSSQDSPRPPLKRPFKGDIGPYKGCILGYYGCFCKFGWSFLVGSYRAPFKWFGVDIRQVYS